jgi:hypothetical protein
MDDEIWRHIQTHEDVPYRVFDLDQRVFDAWTRTPGLEPSASTRQTGLVHADRLLKLYDMVVKKPLIKVDAMVEWGQTVAARDIVLRQTYEDSLRKKGKGRRKAKHDDSTSSSQMADNFAKKASSADTLREMQKDLDATLGRLQADDDDDGMSANRSIVGSPTKRLSNLVASSPLAKVRIASSASTKLNYIINEVRFNLCTSNGQSNTKHVFRFEGIHPEKNFSSFRSRLCRWLMLPKPLNSSMSSICNLRPRLPHKFESNLC